MSTDTCFSFVERLPEDEYCGTQYACNRLSRSSTCMRIKRWARVGGRSGLRGKGEQCEGKEEKKLSTGRVSTETPGRGDTRLAPPKKCRGHTIHTEHPPGATARDSIGSLGCSHFFSLKMLRMKLIGLSDENSITLRDEFDLRPMSLSQLKYCPILISVSAILFHTKKQPEVV